MKKFWVLGRCPNQRNGGTNEERDPFAYAGLFLSPSPNLKLSAKKIAGNFFVSIYQKSLFSQTFALKKTNEKNLFKD